MKTDEKTSQGEKEGAQGERREKGESSRQRAWHEQRETQSKALNWELPGATERYSPTVVILSIEQGDPCGAHTCNPGPGETEAGGLTGVPEQPGLRSETQSTVSAAHLVDGSSTRVGLSTA